jgi:hypothetical protein
MTIVKNAKMIAINTTARKVGLIRVSFHTHYIGYSVGKV